MSERVPVGWSPIFNSKFFQKRFIEYQGHTGIMNYVITYYGNVVLTSVFLSRFTTPNQLRNLFYKNFDRRWVKGHKLNDYDNEVNQVVESLGEFM